MARYCKICGAKSGRCNHLVVDLGNNGGSEDKDKTENKSSEKQK
ncbi:hypothetical protein [Methanolobus profundi]|uniref:Uncharacterized protein n=1 Tax=Methanolobus profundi TaxID=487685 RepID=A0A1I4QTZ0_9EURY|nr:hypothetical protein [Methanolobus profundi]SFM43534.1 hypothetical protein SAMN04488696_1198 [Methanolobus profundi]